MIENREKMKEAKEMQSNYEYKYDSGGGWTEMDKALALRAQELEDRKRKEDADAYLRMYTLKYEDYKESAFENSATLKAQMDLDRKKRGEAQSIVHSFAMNYGSEGDVYERTRSKLADAKKKDREEQAKVKEINAASKAGVACEIDCADYDPESEPVE